MFSHKELCELALRWLKRPNSRSGPGCDVALSECRTGWDGEVPDAIGFRTSAPHAGSVLVEVKTSRSDFLADKNKPHRQSGGVGDWRYYMAPEGVLSITDMPDKWGLLEVNKRGHIKIRKGLALHHKNYGQMKDQAPQWQFADVDRAREQFLLVRVLANTDPQKTLDYTRSISNAHAALVRQLDSIAMSLGLPEGSSSYSIQNRIEMMGAANA
ncbi:adenylosuccinate synthase [Paenalcaligenes niemegkensis]|uniref:adenylosuccinate synthase n=1 Tax=Paenalcaligenes niemegkensis TaxID=2895469 RepID=UPI001EE7B387|nr:adenylosuccinate synthase [Paenalcaligenes niemegkensis]MCQ9618376.1 adenylosuccinate synthase [Paenalcaligenes niemegkensis]